MPKQSKRSRRRSSSSSSDDSTRRLKKKLRKLRKRLNVMEERRGRSRSTENTDSNNSDYSESETSRCEEISSQGIDGDRQDPDVETADRNIPNGNKEKVEGEEENEPELDRQILSILGDDVTPERAVAPPLHKDLATRWTSILKNGLGEEERIKLIKKYPTAGNCSLLEAAKLNLEVATAVNDQVARRDNRLSLLQNQLGAALGAIGKTLSVMLTEEGRGALDHIEWLSDASRMLLDIHHMETNSRRELVSLNLNKELKETLTNAQVDGWLFGDKLGERVKATKELERSSQSLKPSKVKVGRKPLITSTNYQHLNYRRPPRQIQQGARQGGHQKIARTPYNRQQGKGQKRLKGEVYRSREKYR